MPAIEISVSENVIPRTSATCETSFEYAGKPPVAKPTTRPEATIVGNERHGRNTAAGDGPRMKSLPHQSVARKAPTIARAIANFCGKVSRSSIQNRRTRIATIGYTVVDRKSTRLNSSHVAISYAVFCLKKKK